MRLTAMLLYSIVITSCGACKKSYSSMKDFNFLLIDSSTVMNTRQIPEGKAFAIIYFDPDCRDCQKETQEILNKMSEISDTKLYFITDVHFDRLKVFSRVYKTQRFSNIVLGRDYKGDFYNLYHPTGTPYTVLFDSKKRLRTVFGGQTDVTQMIAHLNKLK